MRTYWSAFVILAGSLLAAIPSPSQVTNPNGGTNPGYFANWFNRVDETQAEQPHWATPLATTTPRLEEEFPFDTLWPTNNTRIPSENHVDAKELALIPADPIQLS